MSQYWILAAIGLPVLGSLLIPVIPFRKRQGMCLYIEALVLITSIVVALLLAQGKTQVFDVVHFVGDLAGSIARLNPVSLPGGGWSRRGSCHRFFGGGSLVVFAQFFQFLLQKFVAHLVLSKLFFQIRYLLGSFFIELIVNLCCFADRNWCRSGFCLIA